MEMRRFTPSDNPETIREAIPWRDLYMGANQYDKPGLIREMWRRKVPAVVIQQATQRHGLDIFDTIMAGAR